MIPTKTPPGVEQNAQPVPPSIQRRVIPTKTPPGVEQLRLLAELQLTEE